MKPQPTFSTDPGSEKPIPLDKIDEIKDVPADPPLETEIDDDEGGADPIDPDTGLPYDDSDPGEATVPADRQGGTSAS